MDPSDVADLASKTGAWDKLTGEHGVLFLLVLLVLGLLAVIRYLWHDRVAKITKCYADCDKELGKERATWKVERRQLLNIIEKWRTKAAKYKAGISWYEGRFARGEKMPNFDDTVLALESEPDLPDDIED